MVLSTVSIGMILEQFMMLVRDDSLGMYEFVYFIIYPAKTTTVSRPAWTTARSLSPFRTKSEVTWCIPSSKRNTMRTNPLLKN